MRISALLAVPGGPDEHGVLAGDRRDEQEADDLVLAEEPIFERAGEAGETGRQLLVHLVGRDGHRRRRVAPFGRTVQPRCCRLSVMASMFNSSTSLRSAARASSVGGRDVHARSARS